MWLFLQFTNYKSVQLRDDEERVTRPNESSSLISEEDKQVVNKQPLSQIKLKFSKT